MNRNIQKRTQSLIDSLTIEDKLVNIKRLGPVTKIKKNDTKERYELVLKSRPEKASA